MSERATETRWRSLQSSPRGERWSDPHKSVKTPRIPDIQRLRPDVVIVNTDENRRQTFERLQSVGLRVLVTQTDSLDQIEATWLQLGEATGTAGLANECCERIASARAYNREALRGIRSR